MRNYEIKQFMQERDIQYLYHFTSTENLENILKYGLLPVNKLKENHIRYNYNDELRLDNRLDAVCTSIEFPNYKMFYSHRQKCPNTNWCLVELDANILADKRCLFYIENAARSSEKYRSLYEKQGINGLKALFYNDYGIREELDLPSYYTTNPQSEVQVLDKIEVDYIKQIVFEDNKNKNFFDENIGYKYDIDSEVSKELFKWRCDYKHWKKER